MSRASRYKRTYLRNRELHPTFAQIVQRVFRRRLSRIVANVSTNNALFSRLKGR